jgi:hypothetical protein
VDIHWDNAKGNCVVARRDIPRGKKIVVNPVVPLRFEDTRPSSKIDEYPMWWTRKLDCLAIGAINLLNHSSKPNVRLTRDYRRRLITCFARRKIRAGEELFINYACPLWFTVKE